MCVHLRVFPVSQTLCDWIERDSLHALVQCVSGPGTLQRAFAVNYSWALARPPAGLVVLSRTSDAMQAPDKSHKCAVTQPDFVFLRFSSYFFIFLMSHHLLFLPLSLSLSLIFWVKGPAVSKMVNDPFHQMFSRISTQTLQALLASLMDEFIPLIYDKKTLFLFIIETLIDNK